ncbi:MAG: hypothetical protein Tsb0010_04790 [Parvularculaceae bacterium]
MGYNILLLTGATEAPHLTGYIRAQNPRLPVASAQTLSALEAHLARSGPRTRLISFLTDVIVPAAALAKLTVTPYNIHPGPPEYPGSKPEAFALYDGARAYGATAHEMTAKVDAGPIVHVERFAVDPRWSRLDLGDRAYAAAVDVFAHIGAFCAMNDAPMPRLPIRWGPRKTTNRMFRALCETPPKDAADLARLRRACGEDYVGEKTPMRRRA